MSTDPVPAAALCRLALLVWLDVVVTASCTTLTLFELLVCTLVGALAGASGHLVWVDYRDCRQRRYAARQAQPTDPWEVP